MIPTYKHRLTGHIGRVKKKYGKNQVLLSLREPYTSPSGKIVKAIFVNRLLLEMI